MVAPVKGPRPARRRGGAAERADAPAGSRWVARGARQGRRVLVLIVGGTVTLAGVVMLVTPGPGLVGILAGLAILAGEFGFARRWLQRLRAEGVSAGRNARDLLRRRWQRWRGRWG